MNVSTIIIIIASVGLIVAGIVILNNKSLKNIIKESKIYNDANKFIKFNGYFYLTVGLVGVMLGVLNEVLKEKNALIVPIFMILVTSSSIIQYRLISKFRNLIK